jgi:hypothetical protein
MQNVLDYERVTNSFGSKAANLFAQKLGQPQKVRSDPARLVFAK